MLLKRQSQRNKKNPLVEFKNPCEGEDFVDAVASIDEERANTISLESQLGMQIADRSETESWNIKIVEPLNFQAIEEESDREMDASIWVHQNIIKLSKEFGVVFNRCKKEAWALFKKIDNKRPCDQ